MTNAEIESIRLQVVESGLHRVILLAPADLMEGPTLRRPIAASGVMVLVPGADDRAWLAAYDADRDLDRLEELLSHGIDHGAQGVLVVGSVFVEAVRRLDLPVPVLYA